MITILPIIILAIYFVKSDKYQEPAKSIIGALFLGILIAPVVLILVGPFYRELEMFNSILLGCFMHASVYSSIPEEILKYIALLIVAKKFLSFDEPMDGIVYGSLISLGFAGIENVFYTIEGDQYVAWMRAFTAVPLHAACGAVLGYEFQKNYFNSKKINHIKILTKPIILHFLYNFILFLICAKGFIFLGLAFLALVIYTYRKIIDLGGARNVIHQ